MDSLCFDGPPAVGQCRRIMQHMADSFIRAVIIPETETSFLPSEQGPSGSGTSARSDRAYRSVTHRSVYLTVPLLSLAIHLEDRCVRHLCMPVRWVHQCSYARVIPSVYPRDGEIEHGRLTEQRRETAPDADGSSQSRGHARTEISRRCPERVVPGMRRTAPGVLGPGGGFGSSLRKKTEDFRFQAEDVLTRATD